MSWGHLSFHPVLTAALSGRHYSHLLVCKLTSVHGGQGETEEKEHSRLVGGGFKKQGNFVPGLVLGSKMSRSPHPPAKCEKFI